MVFNSVINKPVKYHRMVVRGHFGEGENENENENENV